MARRKNASFVGVPVSETARDASIYSRTIDNAAGDFALVYDKITGANGHSATDTINHSGSGRGCPMRLPYPSQTINRDIMLRGAGTEADYYILVLPVFIPVGVSEWNLEVDCEVHPVRVNDGSLSVDVFSTSWAQVAGSFSPAYVREAPPWRNGNTGTWTSAFSLTGLGTGWQYIAVKRRLLYDETDPNGYLYGWRFYPSWVGLGESNGLAMPGASATGNPYPTHASTLTPTNAAADDIDAAMTADHAPLDAWVLTRLNRMLGSMWEYVTGSPIPGNNTTTMTTTRDHNRSVFAAEPLLEFPIASVALGCMRVANVTTKSDFLGTLSTSSPIEGPIDWARYPQTTAANEVAIVSRSIMYFPTFSTASSDLDVVVLGLDYSTAGASTWQARISTTGGTGAWVNFAQLGTTNLWSATITAAPFSAGVSNVVAIEVRNTAGGAIGGRELLLLGYGLAFTP